MSCGDWPTLSDLGEPVRLMHGSERACHEGDCKACEFLQEQAERNEPATGDPSPINWHDIEWPVRPVAAGVPT